MSDLHNRTDVERAMTAAWGTGWTPDIDYIHVDFSDMDDALRAVAPAIAARALREMAERTEAETVCCDEYQAFKEGVARPKYAHHICYWGASHAEALRARAAEIERP